jgi:hypothetical protein
MKALFSGEHRRAAMMGVVGLPVIVALLLFRTFSGGGTGTTAAPALPSSVPFTGVTAPPMSVPAPVPLAPIDRALLRNPFCPRVAAPAAAGVPQISCDRRPVPAGRQVVGLVDIFEAGGVRLARMHIGPFTFSNLSVGDTVPGPLRVVALSDRCGDFEYAGNPVPLCEGEQVLR